MQGELFNRVCIYIILGSLASILLLGLSRIVWWHFKIEPKDDSLKKEKEESFGVVARIFRLGNKSHKALVIIGGSVIPVPISERQLPLIKEEQMVKIGHYWTGNPPVISEPELIFVPSPSSCAIKNFVV